MYPLLFLILLAVPVLSAQTANDNSAQQAPVPQTQTAPENPQENQVRLAQQAQARIRARRQQRTQRIVQDTYSHKFEIYGGGGYTRFRPGPSLQHINESSWFGGFTDYLHGRLGVTGDLRGFYGRAFITPNAFNIFTPSISQYTVMAGPQYRLVRREHWAIGAQAVAGVAKGNFAATSANFPGQLVGLWNSGYSFSAAVGVPIDYNIGPGLAARIQPGYWFTTFGSSQQVKNLGFDIGLVYRFGRQ